MERRAGGFGLIFLAVDLPCTRVVWNNVAGAVIPVDGGLRRYQF